VKKPDEAAFEDYIAWWLVEHGGYQELKRGNHPDPTQRAFDAALGIDRDDLFAFIGATQGEAWAQLIAIHGGDAGEAQRKFVERVAGELDRRGTVGVLRHGVVDRGVSFDLAYFKPAHGLTQELVQRYDANRLNVTRQLAYDPANPAKTIDLGLFVNGILVATAELKNPLTHQTVEDAIRQYRETRDPKVIALARRAVVHFAVDPERVAMTTRLAGPRTRFLPFNRGHDKGAGNPPNPHGHRTAYLWEQVWSRDAWLDLLARFVHVEPVPKGTRGPAPIIFPRFHQWDAVLALEADARERGAGQRYLVEHSAGSGKSNTIAWLAHRLSVLHDASDRKVFDKVVVITDRIVLDRQLQDTIYQFEHAHGLVARIEHDSTELAEALSGEQARIVITTLQKFPFVMDKVDDLSQRRYAVIVDEAHSSQTGEAATDLRELLGSAEPEEVDDPAQEVLARRVAARGVQPNLSFFAFTATPKARTLELFGRLNPATQKYEAFHLYPMRQAIEEGFILDVLQNYVTYETYWRIEKAIEDDPRYEGPKARRAIAKYVSLHEHNLSQKAEIVVEHFREHVAAKIDAQAKAMVVTSSRLHAVRFYRALRAYVEEHGYDDVGLLVAFSGTVSEEGIDWTESKLNGFPDTQTVDRFATPAYRILVVAEKYQTGFDQPLLYAMYVDKVLTGLGAVQTLSRLNRICDGKDGTFVLDFRNEATDIAAAFEPWYGETVAPPTDPNLLYDTRHALDEYGVLRPEEIERAVSLLATMTTSSDHARVHAALAPAVDRFRSLDDEQREAFRDAITSFVRTYSFLSQIVTFGDRRLEGDYLYCKALTALIREHTGEQLDLGREVELTHLRHEITFEGRLQLSANAGEVRTIFDGHGPPALPEEEPLSRIIETLNERYGTHLTEADRLHLDGIAADLVADTTLQRQAAVNPIENFKIAFDERFTDAVVERLAASEDLTYRLLDDPQLRGDVVKAYLPLIYGKARVAFQEHCPIGELLGRGEDQHLEFKSTFTWDLERAERSKLVETAALKTVAAFLNSREGGTLLLGVADDGSVLGLEADYAALRKEGRDDRDVFQLHVTQAVINAVGPAAATYVTTKIERVNGGEVCRVHVRPSGHPVYANVTIASNGQHQKTSKFFVRVNNGTRSIDDAAEIERYIAERWPGTPAGSSTEDRPRVTFEDGRWNGKRLRDWVPQAVDDVVRAVDPVQVIVFGSLARGEEDAESDLDLLVVLDEAAPERKRDLMMAIRGAITAPIPVDVVVTDPEELARTKDVNGSLLYWPTREGEVVYERSVT